MYIPTNKPMYIPGPLRKCIIISTICLCVFCNVDFPQKLFVEFISHSYDCVCSIISFLGDKIHKWRYQMPKYVLPIGVTTWDSTYVYFHFIIFLSY